MQVWRLAFLLLALYSQLAEGNRKKRSTGQSILSELSNGFNNFKRLVGRSISPRSISDSDIETECNEGSVLQDGLCSECPAGSSAGGGTCVACPKGTYQPDAGQTTCISCTGGTSTVSVGSDSSDLCLVLCTVPEVMYGAPSPAAGYDLEEGEDVDITCQSGFKINNQNTYTTTCAEQLPSCTYTSTTSENAQMITGTTGVLTCLVMSGDAPTSCAWYKNGVEVSGDGDTVSSDGDTHSCYLSLESFSSDDEAVYQCRAVVNSNTEMASDWVTVSMLEITYDDSDLAIEDGESATLTCSITNPDDMDYPVVVQWVKDDKLIGSPEALLDDPGVTYLALEAVSVGDAGNYSCYASFLNIGDLTSDPKSVVVRATTTPLLDTWAMTGNDVNLTCACVGDAEATVTWAKNYVDVTDGVSTTYSSSTTTSTLTLSEVSDSDAVLYQCTMDIDTTSLFSSAYLYVYTDEGIVIPPIDRSGAEEGSVTFTCTAGNPSSNSVTDVQWFKVGDEDDVEIEEGVTNEDLGNTQYQSELLISDLEFFHMGDYYCKVTYTDLDTLVESDRVTLYVRGIGTSPSSQNPSVGGTASFTCVANGGEAAIDWYLGDVLVESGATLYTYEDSTQTQESVLVVEDVSSDDEGVYQCEATYTSDSSTATSTIATLVIYNIAVTPGYGILGSAVTMTCVINSDREPEQISWRLDNNVVDVSSTSDFSASSKTTINEIIIDPLEEEDFGDYSCIAYYDSLTTSLTADGAALTQLQITSVSASSVVSEGESVTLTCSVNQPAGLSDSATIAWYKSGDSVAGTILETVGTTRTLSLPLEDLELTDAASYTCEASYPEVAGTLEGEEVVLFVRGWQTPLGVGYVVAGNAAYLTCIAQTEEEPDAVSWVVDDSIVSGATNTYEDNLMTSVLYIEPATDKTVECRATVSGVTIETTGSLTLLSVLSESYSDVTMLEGDTREFTCVCDDYMDPIIRWYKDSVALSAGVSSETASDELTSTLTISTAALADRGTYFCMTIWATSGSFTGGALNSRSFTVSVTTVWEDPPSISVIQDFSASLDCHFISSEEADSITWFLDDTEVTLGDSDLITTTYNDITMISSSILEIDAVSASQYGSYKCEAVYNGSDTVSSGVGVVTEISYGFTSVAAVSVAGVGDAVTLSSISLYPEGDTITVTWYKDGTELTDFSTTQLTTTSEEYEYTIAVAAVSDTGSYSCSLYLASTQETFESLPIELYVRGFSVHPTYNLVEVGGEVTFTCILRGDAPSGLVWLKDDSQISTLDPTKTATTTVVDSTTTKSELYAYNIGYGDVGGFKCQASWSSEDIDSDEALLLPASATVADTYGILGGDTSLICVGTVPGDYVPTLVLMKGGESVQSSSNPELLIETTDTYIMEYTIANASSSDFSDAYNCELDYDSESLTSSGYATLFQVEILSISESQSVAYGDTLTLECSATLVSGSTITTTWTKGNQTFNSTSEGSSGSVYSASLELASASDDDAGSYRCSMEYDILGTLLSDAIAIGIDSFKTPPSNTVMFAGNELELICLIKAEVDIMWRKDDNLVDSSNYESTQDEGESWSVLTYSDASAGDSGDYVCEAVVNDKTINSDVATVVVYEFSSSPAFKKVQVGELATLSCSVEALPTTPTVTWQKNGEAFSGDGVTDTSSGEYQSSELRFNVTTADDLGVYRCAADFPSSESYAGGVLYTDEAALMVLYVGMAGAASASEGDTMTLTSTFVNDVEVDIEWYLDDVLLESGSGITMTQEWQDNFENGPFQYVEATLTIDNFETDDTGTYKAQGVATFNGDNLNITGGGTIVDLSNLFLTAGFAGEGEAVTMYCMYDGTGNASSFSFQKEDDAGDWNGVSGDSVSETLLDSTTLEDAKTATNKAAATAGSVLLITEVSSSDVGSYRCTMEDTLGTTTESMTRNLQLLTSSVEEIMMFVETGETAYITCSFSGPYEPDVQLNVFDSGEFVEDDSALWYSSQVSSSTENGVLTKTTTIVFSKVLSTVISQVTKCSATFYDASYPEIQATIDSDDIEVLTASISLSTVEPTLTVYEGIQFTFVCQYSFGTTATVEISPTPVETANEDVTDAETGITTGYTSSLIGTLSTDTSTGPYVCSLEIGGNRIEKELSLEILEIPAVPDVVEMTLQGQDYSWLTCTYTSTLPLMTLSWYTKEDEVESYYTTYRSNEGDDYTGISERVYGMEWWDQRDFHCNLTIPSNSYASEVSFMVNRIEIVVGDVRQFGVSSNEVYAGDELVITCQTESGSTAVLFKYWSSQEINSTVTESGGVLTYTHSISSATLADKGNYWCEIDKVDRWSVYLGYESVEIHNRCEELVIPDTAKGQLDCSAEDESTNTTCTYSCLDDNLMSAEWGESLSTVCEYTGYWSHTTTTELLLVMPTCSEPVMPTTYQVIMVVTFSGLSCPPDRVDEIYDYIVSEKFRDIDMRGFTNTLVSSQNYFTTEMCKFTWAIAPEDGETTTVEDLILVYVDEYSALYSSGKRFAVIESAEDSEASGYEIECPSGSGTSSSGMYCVECGVGTYSTGGYCMSCAIGTYQDQAGQDSCTDCPDGESTLSAGATECLATCDVSAVFYATMDPPAGYIVEAGSDITTTCDEDFSIGTETSVVHVCGTTKYCSRVLMTSGYEGYANRGESYEVTCAITSDDDSAVIMWYKDSTLLNCTDGSGDECTTEELVDGKTTTSVLSVTASESASYTCELESDGDAVPADHDHQLTALVNEIVTSETILFVGNLYEFTCHGEQPEGVDLPPTIQAFVSGKEVFDGVTSDDGLNLVVSFQATSDVALTCEYLYIQVEQDVVVVADTDTFNIVGLVSAPTRDLFIPDSEPYVLECDMHNVEAIQIVQIDGETETTIIAADAEDVSTTIIESQTSLQYYCRGTSGSEYAESTPYTFTFGTTNLISHPADVYTIGASISFTCEVPAGSTVSFKKTDNTALDLSSQTVQSVADSGDETFTLTVASPTADDNGEYYCEGAGGRSKGAMLNFVQILVSPEDSYRDDGESVTFMCEASGVVDISWSTPSGDVATDPHTQFLTDEGYTVGELIAVAGTDTSGLYYCIAEGIVSSDSAELVAMIADLTAPDSVVTNEEITVTCVIYGDHDGITMSNDGRLLTVETPLDALTTKASGEGTIYTSTYNTSLSTFTNDTTTFSCTAYYDSFGEQHTEEVDVYLFGFSEQPSDIDSLSEDENSLSAMISAHPDQTIEVVLMKVEDDGEDLEILRVDSIESGSTSVGFTVTFETEDTGYYYYQLEDNEDTTISSDTFKVTVYGGYQDAFVIPYPGSSLDSLTLTCVFNSPSELTVTWSDDSGSMGADSPLVTTTFEDELLTSYCTISAGGNYECSATLLGTEITVTYEVQLLDFVLAPADPYQVFFDNTEIDLATTPDSDSLTVAVFSADGTEVDISQPQNLYESRNLTSVVSWTDDSGLHSGDYYQTDIIYVAGVYLETPESFFLLAGETSLLQCTAVQTADITVTSVTWSDGDGVLSTVSFADEGAGPTTIIAETNVTWRGDLTAGDEVQITCTVQFSADSSEIEKSAAITVTINEKCSTLYDVENGVLAADAATIYPSDTVTVSCNDGYQLSGQSLYTCKDGALWDEPPTCVEMEPLCSAVAPEMAKVIYIYPEVIMSCIDEYAPFKDDSTNLICGDDGWDALSTDNPVSSFNFCGRKMTPYSKSVTASVTYKGSQYCTTTDDDDAAYLAYESEVDFSMDGIDIAFVGCVGTDDGYVLSVKYTVDYVYLSDFDYLDLDALTAKILASDGTARRKRTATWTFDSLTFQFDLNCPLDSPQYNDQCVECPAGYYSTGTACLSCPKGEYQYDAGRTFCLACPSGETTPGLGSDSLDDCGGPCTIPEIYSGQTFPLGGSAVPESTAVTVACDAGYSVPYNTASTYSCSDFAVLANVDQLCEEICVVPASLVSEDHVDVVANTNFLPGETVTVACVEGYSAISSATIGALELECSAGALAIREEGYCDKDGLSTGMWVLIIMLVILLLLLLILIPLCCYLFKNNDKEDDEREYKDLEMRPQSAYSCSNHVMVRGTKTESETNIGNSNPFKVSDFNDYIRGMASNRNEGFIREFRSISVGSDTKKIISQLSENYNKNRYATITTYDHSRVRLLKINNDPNSDYINASYINGYVTPNAYIATQGPLQNTVDDFWRMIWEQNVSSVVMLTNLTQSGQVKSFKYWPDTEQQFGVVKVKKMSENKFGGFAVRELDIEVEGKQRTVFQYHYAEWPDVGYPVEEKFLTFLYYIRHMRQDSKKPLVVHCSAGAGWTGVFLGLDLTLDRLTKEDTVDVLGCVNSMRQQRSAMVQNEPQYIFLHKLLVDCVNGELFAKLRANRFRSNLDGAIFVNPSAAGLNDYEGGF